MDKILFVINTDWYFNLHWMDRAKHCQHRGSTVIIATHFTTTELRENFTQEGFICHHIPFTRRGVNPFKELRALVAINRLIQQIQPTIIHCATIKPNIYTSLIPHQTPTVLGITGLGCTFSTQTPALLLIKQLVITLYKKIALKKNTHFIFENTDDYQRFKTLRIIHQHNGTVIEGAGVNTDTFTPTPPPNNNTILFAARLLKNKGLLTLIEAVTHLRQKGMIIRLLVAGIIDQDAHSSLDMMTINALAKEKTIEWLGTIHDMPALIQQADIVCLPSQYGEGVPRILIEAAACGRALIASDIPGCRAIVHHDKNGYLVPPRHVHRLATAIENLCNNPEKCRQFGLFSRQKAIKTFSSEQVIQRTLAVYKKLLEPPSAP